MFPFLKKKEVKRIRKPKQLILWFDELSIEDVPIVGGKNASLGEMYRELTAKGVLIPNGFAVTAHAYQYLLDATGIREKIKGIMKGLNTKNLVDLADRGHKVRELIKSVDFPEDLKKEISVGYKKLCKQYGERTDVAVRSSATAEDLPDASFAGQQETYLNIRGEYELIDACRRCFASLFTNRAISYREDKHFDHFAVSLSIGIQKMVRSDKACSGVMFTLDTETGFSDAVFVTGSYGLGENIVQGNVNPDEYYVFKPTLKEGYKPIIAKTLGTKKLKMIYSSGVHATTRNVAVSEHDQKSYVLTNNEILTLAAWGCIVEDHYSKKAGKVKPMDLEWAKDGITGKLFIVQARPETVHSQKNRMVLKKYVLQQKGKQLLTGRAVGELIGQGVVNIIKDAKDITKFKPGQVLVTEMTDPDWEPIMKVAAAIITERGGRTAHAAIISRELGLPCIVGTNIATKVLKHGQKITADCSQGEEGVIYDGLLKFAIKTINLAGLPKTKTKIMMNLGTPQQAFEKSFLPNDGIGLAREEFIINSYIKIHPKALLHYGEITDNAVKAEIDALTYNYPDKSEFFVTKLAEGVGMIASAFYPKPVIVRLSDFKSNEYANLIGGHLYEPKEENPMLGWRGASRYYSDAYKEAFVLECRALRKVREEMGLKNVIIMVPFCRTVEEGKKVIALLKQHGLEQGKHGLKIYAMCEIPSNVILAEQFLDVFDGFSIGSNDLTQLTLGVDRDSALVSHVYQEQNDAVKILLEQVIKIARKKGKYIGICGDAPSSYPEFAKFLVKLGISSLSLSPDAIISTTMTVANFEKKGK